VIGRHRYLKDGHDLPWLQAELAPLRDRIHQLLQQGTRCRHPKTRNFCLNLLDEYAALGRSARCPGSTRPTTLPNAHSATA
jgi:hypothetical protein